MIEVPTEAKLKSALTQKFRIELTDFETIRHEDKTLYGVPDMSVTGGGWTTWLEVKLAKPRLKKRGRQDLRMRRLARHGRAYFVVYCIEKNVPSTIIITPADLLLPLMGWNVRPDWKERARAYAAGFSHRLVIDFIKETHGARM